MGSTISREFERRRQEALVAIQRRTAPQPTDQLTTCAPNAQCILAPAEGTGWVATLVTPGGAATDPRSAAVHGRRAVACWLAVRHHRQAPARHPDGACACGAASKCQRLMRKPQSRTALSLARSTLPLVPMTG